MSQETLPALELACYIVAARVIVKRLKGGLRQGAFALVNLAALYGICFYFADHRYDVCFILYCGLALVQYAALRFLACAPGWKPWLAFALPIVALIITRYFLQANPANSLFP